MLMVSPGVKIAIKILLVLLSATILLGTLAFFGEKGWGQAIIYGFFILSWSGPWIVLWKFLNVSLGYNSLIVYFLVNIMGFVLNVSLVLVVGHVVYKLKQNKKLTIISIFLSIIMLMVLSFSFSSLYHSDTVYDMWLRQCDVNKNAYLGENMSQCYELIDDFESREQCLDYVETAADNINFCNNAGNFSSLDLDSLFVDKSKEESNVVSKQENISHYKNSHLGFSFDVLPNWQIASEVDSGIVLEQVTGNNQGDKITISLVKDNIITDTDNKFGSVTYYYDQVSNSWMKKGGVSEMTGESIPDALAVAKAYTAEGDGVFLGTKRWLTYIIPMSPNSVLKLNITGSGETKSLEDLVKTLRKL